MLKPPFILVIGLGPAGTAASIGLAQWGFRVLAIDRSRQPSLKIGESLAPAAQGVLQQLGVWEAFQRGAHQTCFGNRSAWGSSAIQYHDFIRQPPGYGWHIDRPAFEQLLIEKARQLGVSIAQSTSIREANWQQTHWEVHLKGPIPSLQQVQPTLILDASGRHSFLGRQLGIDRLYEDRQLALVAFLAVQQTLDDTTSLTETGPDGWWYSAQIPGKKIASAFLCNPNSTQKKDWTTESGWWQLVQQYPHTAQRFEKAGVALPQKPYFVAADSSILSQLYGPGWLALGDAAMSYDPIAAHGLLMAMVSGRDAAMAIRSLQSGEPSALLNYQDQLFKAYQHYQIQRKSLYQQERRFPRSTYWQKRQQLRPVFQPTSVVEKR
ncbi:MAG: NAD(P)/FAD-dependent oxidoreductase [Bacteroidota bacterium]